MVSNAKHSSLLRRWRRKSFKTAATVRKTRSARFRISRRTVGGSESQRPTGKAAFTHAFLMRFRRHKIVWVYCLLILEKLGFEMCDFVR